MTRDWIARYPKKRAAIDEKIAANEAHRELCIEMRDLWTVARDSWIVEARQRGLTLLEMGNILGVTSERVRQLEKEAGITPRSKSRMP